MMVYQSTPEFSVNRLHEPSEFGNELPLSKWSRISRHPDGLKEGFTVLKEELRSMKAEIGDIKNEIKDLKMCMAEIGEYLKEEVNFNLVELIYQLQPEPESCTPSDLRRRGIRYPTFELLVEQNSETSKLARSFLRLQPLLVQADSG